MQCCEVTTDDCPPCAHEDTLGYPDSGCMVLELHCTRALWYWVVGLCGTRTALYYGVLVVYKSWHLQQKQ